MSLEDFLQNKPLFYDEIDYDFFPRLFKKIKNNFKIPKIVHIVGTNGKGSTGRFLALMLKNSGKLVAHYTSPHIFDFSERFWIQGKIASKDELQNAHDRIYPLLNEEEKAKISYFEYATLLILPLFEKCEFWVIEAGMGGEKDATNVFDKKLSLFAQISLDHTAILGNSIKKIAKTKFNSMQDYAILNDKISKKAVKVAQKIANFKNSKIDFAKNFLTKQEKNNIKFFIKKQKFAKFQKQNLRLAYAAMKFLNLNPDLKALKNFDLKGRCEKISHNIFIDVGHNEGCAKAILKQFKGKKIVLIYNSFLDKDIKKILLILFPIIKRIEIFKYESENRKLANDKIKNIAKGLKVSNFCGKKSLQENEIYLVFGSFLLVENFLKDYFEK